MSLLGAGETHRGLARKLVFMAPGNPLTATGGYEYDRRMVQGLESLGWTVAWRTLDDSFPTPTEHALIDAERQLAALADRSLVVIDGLALGAMPDVSLLHAQRLRLIALVHHPLAAETGLPPELADRLATSERAALTGMRAVIVTSTSTRQALAEYAVPADKIMVVEPGVDAASLIDARQLLDPKAPVHMLCVATITPRKAHDLLVEALSGLRDHAWTLTCVGSTERSPSTSAALRTQIAAAGLEHRIALTGEIEAAALADQLQRADLFVLASQFEGYGMAIAQALAHGLPVIGTRTGAIGDLVYPEGDPQAGLLIEPGDGSALREALRRVLSDRSLLQGLASAAREVGAKLPDWQMASQRLSDVLDGVADWPLWRNVHG